MKFITVEHAKKAKLTPITVTGQAFKAKCKQKYVQMRYRKKNFIVYETEKRELKQQQITNRRGQA
jgi:hypothetical protein